MRGAEYFQITFYGICLSFCLSLPFLLSYLFSQNANDNNARCKFIAKIESLKNQELSIASKG